MNISKSLWASIQGDPVFMRKLHGWLTVIWFVAAFPIMMFWSQSVVFLVFVSVYAVVTGHWSSWQASRVEVKQDEQQ
jgi:ABC-type lipoprotein release transport system permease subunit